MFGLNSKSAAGSGYVVVQTVYVAGDPDFYMTPAADREAALRIFDGVMRQAPGVFLPDSRNQLRVMSAERWQRIEDEAEQLATVLLAESMGGPDDDGPIPGCPCEDCTDEADAQGGEHR